MIDLKKFCHPDPAGNRRNLLEPWRCKQGIAASNGHIMIVVPDQVGDFADEVEYMHGVIERFEKQWIGGGEWIQASSIALPDAEPCIECGGTGRDDDCLCIFCDGTGDDYQVCKVGNAFAQRKYLAMLADLPDCVVSPDGTNPMPFKFTGGHGWLSPCRPAPF